MTQRLLKIYLSGAAKNVDEEFQNWRDLSRKYVDIAYDTYLELIDPLRYFNYTDSKPLTDKQCINYFMWLIEHSDIVLVNVSDSNTSVGTMAEVEHAYCHHIPIIGFGNQDTAYNWVTERCEIVLNTLDEALEYINFYYGGIV